MDKEEIIERLEEIAKHAVHVFGEELFFMSLDDGIAIHEAIDILKSAQPERPEQPESAREYCMECNHIEMCRWYPYEGCEFRSLPIAQPEIIRCKDCKHYYYADNRIPQEQRYVCDLDGDRWKPDSFCSFAERRANGVDR